MQESFIRLNERSVFHFQSCRLRFRVFENAVLGSTSN